jgi:hypothetical protein
MGGMMPSRRERFERISREAREQTNRALADEISSLTFLTEEEVERILPRKVDKERFGDLMAIVPAHTDDNTKVASLREKLDEVGVVLVKVLKLLL